MQLLAVIVVEVIKVSRNLDEFCQVTDAQLKQELLLGCPWSTVYLMFQDVSSAIDFLMSWMAILRHPRYLRI